MVNLVRMALCLGCYKRGENSWQMWAGRFCAYSRASTPCSSTAITAIVLLLQPDVCLQPESGPSLPASTSNGLLLTVRHVASHWYRGVLGSALSPYTRPSRDAYQRVAIAAAAAARAGGGKGYICVVLSKSSNALGVCSVKSPIYNGLFRVPAGLRAVAFTFRARARGQRAGLKCKVSRKVVHLSRANGAS